MAEGPKTQMPARRKARKRALDVLYEADLRDLSPTQVLVTYLDRIEKPRPDHLDYTISLVEGVTGRKAQIDELLAEHAQGWTLDRMPKVDLAVLRVGVYELLWAEDVPDPVAIDEAVGLAKELSTDDSPRFVNGVLGRIGTIADRLRAVL
jgi:N utilization substance protein B